VTCPFRTDESNLGVFIVFCLLRIWSSLEPQPMITYDEGLLSLPDDIINEILGLLDMKALKSCSLTGKALSCSAKPFIHQTLHLGPRSSDSIWYIWSNSLNHRYEFKGLRVLGERGLLQHIRHLLIHFPNDPSVKFVHGLDPNIHHLHTLTNVRSLRTYWMNIPLCITKVEEYFGAFLGSLQSLELNCLRGDDNILYFVCQFPNLRNLTIDLFPDYSNSECNDGSRFDIKTSPPFDGTLDLRLGMSAGFENDSKRAQLILRNLVTLPSGLKFRTLKLSWCTGDNLQLLIDACAPTLECVEFTGRWSGALFLCRMACPELVGFDCQTFPLVLGSVSNNTPRSDNL